MLRLFPAGLASACLSLLAHAAPPAAQPGGPAPPAGSDWPNFRGPRHDGTSPERGLLRSFPPGGPKVLWTVPVGPGYGPPAVRDGEVFLLDRRGNSADELRVLDFATGKQKWSYEYLARGALKHDGSRSTPTVDEKLIFSIGPFGDIRCVSRETHKPLWKLHLLRDFGGEMPRWGVAQSPLLDGDRIIVAPQSRTVGLAALDKSTGRVLWKSPPIGEMRYVSPAPATLAGRRQVLMLSFDTAVGVDPGTGRELWRFGGFSCRNSIPDLLPLDANRVLITGGYDAGTTVLRVEGGGDRLAVRPVARHDEVGAQIHPPYFLGGFLYALCNTNTADDGLVCFDQQLKVRWQTRRSPSLDRGGMVLTADGLLYSMDGRSGELRIIQPGPDGYRELAKSPPLISGQELWSPLVLSCGRLLIRDHKQLKCIDLRPGP